MPAPRNVLLIALILAMTGIVQADDESPESALIAILQSDADPADKAITCKKLAIDGTAAAVPELAKLLPDPQLSSWARIALEAIPGPEADEALRNAAESVEGVLLVGMINSIGIRQDASAVEGLSKRLQDEDAEVAAAAAVALGHIGNPASIEYLQAALADAPPIVGSAAAEGCVLCAERLLSDGDTAQAIAIFDEIRSADVPLQRRVEATRGAILARGDDGIPLLMEQFRSDERAMFRLALSTSREFPGNALDKVLVSELQQANPDRAALIVQAMADRPDTVVLSAILDAATDSALPVRLSAIDALARVGNDSCLEPLLNIATEDDVNLGDAAKETLAVLPGDTVDDQIVARLSDAKGAMYPLLLTLIGDRRIDAVPQLIKALEHADKVVRHAALTSLGETVPLNQLSVLISQVIKPKNADDREVAELALKTAAVRMPDRDACASQLASAVRGAPKGTKTTLLEILSDVGGTRALQALAEAAKSGNEELLDASSRLLGKWNSVEAAPVLLDLAKTSSERKYQVRALRGYVGLARKFPMSENDRAAMCENAMNAAIRVDEKKLALDVLNLHASKPGLNLTLGAISDPEIKSHAQTTALAIVGKLGQSEVDMKDVLARIDLDKVTLEIVKAEYGSDSDRKDVTEILQQQAEDVPLITLNAGSYNETFGGDPAPDSPKTLTVQYRINGKDGEIKFAENDLILLPMPE